MGAMIIYGIEYSELLIIEILRPDNVCMKKGYETMHDSALSDYMQAVGCHISSVGTDKLNRINRFDTL